MVDNSDQSSYNNQAVFPKGQYSAIQNPVIVMVTGFLSCFFLYFFLNSPLLLFGHGNRLNKPLHPLSGLPAHLPGGEGADILLKRIYALYGV